MKSYIFISDRKNLVFGIELNTDILVLTTNYTLVLNNKRKCKIMSDLKYFQV